MIRFLGEGDPEQAPTDIRVWTLESIESLLTFNQPFVNDFGEVLLDPLEHRKAFLAVHFLYEDRIWSTEDYFKEVYHVYTEKSLEQLKKDGYIGFVMYEGKKCMYVTPKGEDAYYSDLLEPRIAAFIEDALKGDSRILITDDNIKNVEPIDDDED